jgi:hypothetical protein
MLVSMHHYLVEGIIFAFCISSLQLLRGSSRSWSLGSGYAGATVSSSLLEHHSGLGACWWRQEVERCVDGCAQESVMVWRCGGIDHSLARSIVLIPPKDGLAEVVGGDFYRACTSGASQGSAWLVCALASCSAARWGLQMTLCASVWYHDSWPKSWPSLSSSFVGVVTEVARKVTSGWPIYLFCKDLVINIIKLLS